MRKVKFLTLILLAGIFTFSSCTKHWEELNTNPNNPSDVPATNILGYVIQGIGRSFFNDWQGMNNFLSYAGQVTKIQYTDEAHYVYRESTVNAAWRDYYRYLYNLQTIIKKANDGDNDRNEQHLKAAAMVLSAMLWQMATDQWEVIPFREALKGDDPNHPNTNPKYDTQDTIYYAINDMLKTASNLLANPAGGPLGEGDILFNGDLSKWEKFANSLRLRVAIRMSYVDENKAREIFNEVIGGNLPIMQSNDDNAFIWWPGSNPWYEPWYYNRHVRNRDDHGMAKTIIDTLLSFNDPRIGVYAKPYAYDSLGNPIYVGQVEGAGTNTNVSRIGTRFRDDPAGFTPLMRYAEVEFILAEAAQRGLITGDAKAYYEAGVRASMKENGIADTLIDAYLANPKVAWDSAYAFHMSQGPAGPTYDDHLAKIYIQKWIALFKQGQEVWAEQRRTDFPPLPEAPLSPYGTHNRQPFRYPYPVDEKNLNGANYHAAVDGLGIKDDFWGRQMWWDVRKGVH